MRRSGRWTVLGRERLRRVLRRPKAG